MAFHILFPSFAQEFETYEKIKQQSTGSITLWTSADAPNIANAQVYEPQKFLNTLKSGDIVFHLRGGEQLAPDTLCVVAQAFAGNPSLALVYGDDSFIHKPDFEFVHDPVLKPDFSPAFLSNYNYMGDNAFFSADYLKQNPSLCDDNFLQTNYAAILSLCGTCEKVLHLDQALMLENAIFSAKDQRRLDADKRALQNFFRNLPVSIQEYGNRFFLYNQRVNQRVCIVAQVPDIYTPQDYAKIFLNITRYPNYQLVLLTEASNAESLPDNVELFHFDGTAEAYNEVLRDRDADIAVLICNGAIPRQKDWIQNLLTPLTIWREAAVSPLVTDQDINIIYAGTHSEAVDVFGYAFFGRPFSYIDDVAFNQTYLRETAALSSAVFAVRCQEFFRLGGLEAISPDLGSSFLDFGLKIRNDGGMCVYTPLSYFVCEKRLEIGRYLALRSRWGKMLTDNVFFTDKLRENLFDPLKNQAFYSVREPLTRSFNRHVAILVGNLHEDAQRKELQAQLLSYAKNYVCVMGYCAEDILKTFVNETTDCLYFQGLRLGRHGIFHLLEEFDEVHILSDEYAELKKQLHSIGIKTFDSTEQTLPPPKIGMFEVENIDDPNISMRDAAPIDVIVPVYNGYSFLRPLFRSIHRTKMNYRLIIVNDCSPDPLIQPILRAAAAEIPNTILLENEENLGFVRSVNRALEISCGHVAIVNTDVEVPENWLERLMIPILLDETIASTTPFTNSGTICSFPNFDENNPAFMNLSVDEIDQVFKNIKPDYYEIPTGVGFCMGMSRNALDRIGYLDAKAFEKGYGEENDWCLRAQKQGFSNVLINNLFVYHKHGGSFVSEEKQKLIDAHGKILQVRYPFYAYNVSRFIAADPYKKYRSYAAWTLVEKYGNGGQAFFSFDKSYGGGAAQYLRNVRKKILDGGQAYFAISYDISGKCYALEASKYQSSVIFDRLSLDQVLAFLEITIPKNITINEIVSYPSVPAFLDKLCSWQENTGIPIRMLVHDFYCICPSYTLVKNGFVYCRLPEESVCLACAENSIFFGSQTRDIVVWRQGWGKFLRHCEEIVCFSNDSKSHLLKIYPDLKIRVLPHTISPLQKVTRRKREDEYINIAVLGGISETKGLLILEEMSRLALEQGLKIRIVIIGYTARTLIAPNVITTGKYVREELPALLKKYEVDLVLIPSVWPETFSYTTQEAISMGMPVAVFNIGAPAERVRSYPHGLVISKIDAQTAIDEISAFMQNMENQ